MIEAIQIGHRWEIGYEYPDCKCRCASRQPWMLLAGFAFVALIGITLAAAMPSVRLK